MTCECPRQVAAGWCQHCLVVFSDREVFEGDKQRQAFEHIVGGTYLENTANKLTKALDAFAVAYRQMKFDRPADLDPSQLNSFANRANQAGLDRQPPSPGLEKFIDELRLRPPSLRTQADDHGRFVSGQITHSRIPPRIVQAMPERRTHLCTNRMITSRCQNQLSSQQSPTSLKAPCQRIKTARSIWFGRPWRGSWSEARRKHEPAPEGCTGRNSEPVVNVKKYERTAGLGHGAPGTCRKSSQTTPKIPSTPNPGR